MKHGEGEPQPEAAKTGGEEPWEGIIDGMHESVMLIELNPENMDGYARLLHLLRVAMLRHGIEPQEAAEASAVHRAELDDRRRRIVHRSHSDDGDRDEL